MALLLAELCEVHMSTIDPKAQQAWNKVKDAVRILAYRMVHSPDEANAIENIVFYKVTRNYYEREHFSEFKAYALTIATNEARRVIRAGRRWSPLPETDTFEDEDFGSENEDALFLYNEPQLASSETYSTSDQTYSIKDIVWSLLKKARDKDYITQKDYDVVTSRLELHEFTWDQTAESLGISKTNCMTTHSRVLNKLNLYLFMECPVLLGGLVKIKSTFDHVVQKNPDFLLEAEATAFRQAVLLRRKLPGTTGALQSACDKMIRKFTFEQT